MDSDVLVIADDFNFRKYHPEGATLPYEATAAKLRDEILARQPTALEISCPASPAAMREAMGEATCLVSYRIDAATLAAAPRLRWIQAGSAGIDHFLKMSDVGLAALQRRGVALTSAAGSMNVVIGEHVLGMILMFARGFHRAMRQQLQRRWEIFMGDEAYGRTVGVIGLGEIGSRVAELCKRIGMRVIGTKRSPDRYTGLADEVLPADAYRRVLREADYVVLACSLDHTTRGMINAETLASMKPNAVLINIGRGELVVEADLVAALRDGRIAGAGLDTFGVPGRSDLKHLEALDPASALWDLPNVIISPNNAAATPRIYEYLAAIVVENHRRLRDGLEMTHRIV
jgi:phosphoglycerate dehydrogenase-like enzyme